MKYVAVIAVALVLAVSGGLGLADRSDAPADPGVRVAGDPAQVVVAGADLDATVAALQQRLREVPEDDRSWATLGLAYVEQARVTGDASFYAKAEDAVEESLALRPEDNAVGHAAAGALAAARHDFTESLAEAETALEVDPFDPTALVVRVDALTELGRYDEQLAAVRQADRRQPGVPSAARYAYALELRGELAAASDILRRAAGSARPADEAYLLTLLADLDRRRGRLDEAARHLRQARRADPDHVPALVSQARLHVAEGRLDEAVDTWQDVVTRLPLPEYLTELGELHLHLDDREAAEQQFAVVETTIDLLEEGGVNADLETALYEADHGEPRQALESARVEWGQRRSLHVADALAWALHATGRDEEALRFARQATRLGTQEAVLWLHRGLVEAELGLTTAARRHLRAGLAMDPGVSPYQADRARAALRALGAR